jgi:hypothetical protein
MKVMGTAGRTAGFLAGLLLMAANAGAEDRQLRPFIGATFGGGTTFVELDRGRAKLAVGVGAVFLGEVFGAEVDFGDVPGFFESDDNPLVVGSRVTTLTGNVVVAMPRRMTEYALRPYVVGGGGLMRVRTTTSLNVFDVSRLFPTLDVGVGVVGFVTNRMGVSWEIRRFQSLDREGDNGVSFGDEQLGFWRATMAVAIRY